MQHTDHLIDSLFGALAPQLLPDETTLPGSDPLRQDVVVDGSVVQALRDGLAAQRALKGADAEPAAGRAQAITLLDPSGQCAGPVMHALAQACDSPVQQLHVRERTTLRTLAVVARNAVRRPAQAPLQVFCTQVREPGLLPLEIAHALAEDADLTVVLASPLPPAGLVALRSTLLAATHRPGWRCPDLVFVLPPDNPDAQSEMLRAEWPAGLRVRAVTDHHGQAAGLWNSVMDTWSHMRQSPPETGAGGLKMNVNRRWPTLTTPVWPLPPKAVEAMRPSREAANEASVPRPATVLAPVKPHAAGHGAWLPTLDQTYTGRGEPPAADLPASLPTNLPTEAAQARLLASLAGTEGLLAWGIVDLRSGALLAAEHRAGAASVDLNGLARALCAARQAHLQQMGPAALPDEVLITSGNIQSLLRRLPGPRSLGFVAQLQRHQANLALLRFRLQDAAPLLL